MIPRKPKPRPAEPLPQERLQLLSISSSIFEPRTQTPNINPNNNIMDSLNFFKGYGKINNNPVETHSPKPPILKVTLFAILLLTLLIGLALAALIQVSSTEPPRSPSLSSPQSLKSICSLTRYPNTCFTSLNSSTKLDPVSISNVSLTFAIKELSNSSLYIKNLSLVSNDAALSDCTSQIEDALSQLGDSVAELGKKGLSEESVRNVRTWVSAAMADGETCLDGLEEMGSSFVDEIKARMEKPKELMSNALALFAKMDKVFKMCGMAMH